MELNVQEWKEFLLPKIFNVTRGTRLTTYDRIIGKTPFITAGEENNGVTEYIGNIEQKQYNNSLTIDMFGNCFYQCNEFCADDNILILENNNNISKECMIFIATVINQDKYRYTYGRQYRQKNYANHLIKLPILYNQDKTPFVDKNKIYSNKGYVPDWKFMENYIKSLHHKPITTKVKSGNVKELGIDNWEEFKVSDLFNVKYGINMELNTCIETTYDDPEGIAFVARTAENNGVSAYVKRVEGKEPQPAETITVAGGGSVLSTFVQKRPFYSGRDLYLLISKEEISLKVKMFISTVLFSNQYRYSYGRQSNKTLPELILKLPIQRDSNRKPIIDNNRTYSDKGYIPDWQFMEDYTNSLPYSDRI